LWEHSRKPGPTADVWGSFIGWLASPHLTPTTQNHDLARHWFDQFEGAELDGLIAKRLDLRYQPGKRVLIEIKNERTTDCVVAGYRVHKSGPGAIGSLLLGL
jgi:ATP-dependent DNA ligase